MPMTRAHRRLLRIGIALLCLLIILGIGIPLTSAWWLPLALPYLSKFIPNTRIQAKHAKIDLLGGSVMFEDLVIDNPHAASPAIQAEHLDFVYSSLREAMKGKVEYLKVRGASVDAARLMEIGPPPSPKTQPTPPLYDTLAQWVPVSSDFRNVRVILPGGTAYALHSARIGRKDLPKSEMQLSLDMVSVPVSQMLPIKIDRPLTLSLIGKFSPKGFQLVHFRSNLASLMRTGQSGNGSPPAALEMKDFEIDLDQWARVMPLPVAGQMRFDLAIPDWSFSSGQPARGETIGDYLTRLRIAQSNLRWKDSLREWAISDSSHTLAFALQSSPDFKRGRFDASSKLRIGTFDLGGMNTLKDCALDLDFAAGRDEQRKWFSARFGGAGPDASLDTPAKTRLRLEGEVSASASLGEPLSSAGFRLQPSLESAARQFAVPMSGLFYRADASDGELYGIATSGTLAQGAFTARAQRISGGPSNGSASLSVTVSAASLADLRTGLQLAGRTANPMEGQFETNAAWDRLTSESWMTSGTLALAKFQMSGQGGQNMTTRPANIDAAWTILARQGLWNIARGSLELDRNLRIAISGDVDKTPEALKVHLAPSAKIADFARLMSLSPRAWPVDAQGSAATSGTLDWQQSAKAARIVYTGRAHFADLSLSNLAGGWTVGNVKANLPISLTWYQDMVHGTLQRPVASLDVSFPPTPVDIDRIGAGLWQARWLSPVVALDTRLFFNPRLTTESIESTVLQMKRYSVDVPGVASIKGEGQANLTRRSDGTWSPAMETTFGLQIADAESFCQTFGLGEWEIAGSGSWRDGRVYHADGMTTISGNAEVNSPKGSARPILLAWQDLKAKGDFAVPFHAGAATSTSQTTVIGSGNLNAARLTVGGFPLQDVELEANLHQDGWTVRMPNAVFAQGMVALEAKMDPSLPLSHMSANARIFGMDLAAFTREYHPGNIRMEGKVDVIASVEWDGSGMPLLTGKVTSASPQVLIDKATIKRLLVDWAQQGGAIMLGGVEYTLQKKYRDTEMVPFDTFSITSRSKGNKVFNTVQMKNKNFNITFEPNTEWAVIVDFLKLKQEEQAKG